MHIIDFKSLLRGFFSILLLGFVSLAQAAETGLLWRIESPGGMVSHVFGTIHVDDVRVTDFSPVLLQALESGDVFMMETLPPGNPALYFLPGHNLRELLSEQEWEQVRQLADERAMQDDVAMRLKPWLLAMMLGLPANMGPYTQDVRLYAKAQELGKETQGLESAEEHFTLLDSLNREEQLEILRSVLRRSEDEKVRDVESLLDAYLEGDAAVIAMVDEQVTGDTLPPALWQKMRVRLLDERNATMAKRIADKAMHSRLFVAVGAAHLAGEEGVLARLRRAGYRLSALQ
jgi:uncharacterized protein YbaP (TraB family)